MYPITNAFNTAVSAPARSLSLRVTFNDTRTLDGAHIIHMALSETMASGSELSMGEACSNKLTLSLRMPDEELMLSGGYVDAEAGLELADGTVEYCPLGRFYISEVTSSDDYRTVTITGFDAMSQLNEPYITTLTEFPATVEAVAGDIAAQYGLTVAPISFPLYTINYIDASAKEMLGYIAGLMGKNAVINRDGELEFLWYADADYALGRDVQYLNGFKRTTADDFVLGSLTSGTQENPLSVGSGAGVNFMNPFMTQEILEEIYERVKFLEYTPCEIKYRGNPALELGDICRVEDKNGVTYNALIMRQELKLSGGMNGTISSLGVSQAETAMAQSPTSKKIEVVYEGLVKALKDATDTIKGTNGGYYTVETNDLGQPEGWTIRDTPTQTPTTKMWRMSMGGLAFSEDGGETFSNFALDLNGNISAGAITTGVMSAQRIAMTGGTLNDFFRVEPDEDGHPVISIGAEGSSVVLRQMHNRIGFYDGAGNELAAA